LDALAQVFADRGDAAPLVVGSVKTNLGHLESAAGIAGFIKTVLSVRYGYIPKHLNFHQLTPHASQDATRLTIASPALEWPTVPRPRRAGVSSFGVSGTNAHIIVEQAPSPEPAVWEPDSPVTTLVVAGKSSQRIAATAAMLAQWMTGPGAEVRLADVAHTLNHHRAQHRTFATICARDHNQAVAGLSALAAGQAAVGVVGAHDGPCRPGRVFVYSGQGSQWAGMGRRLLTDEPAFATAIDTLEPAFRTEVGFSLREVLEAAEPLTGIERIQPVLTGLQLALTELWRHYGVVPDAVIGHSMGEVAAAVTAGALTPTEGLRVIATRSRLMSRLAGQGAMALLELDPASTLGLIAEYPAVTLAVYASPTQTVIAGPPADVDMLIAKVAQQSRLARRIDVDVASHHPTIDPVLPDLQAALSDLAPKPPAIPIISTTYDESQTPTTSFDADHWVANLRRPVRFSQAIAAAGTDHATFIEISPHPLLTHSIADTLAGTHFHTVPTLQRDGDDTHTFHTNLNSAHTGAPPRTSHPPEPHPVLPATPWHHTRLWIKPTTPQLPAPAAGSNGWSYASDWPIGPITAADTAGDGSWVVFADDGCGAKVSSAVGDAAVVTVLPMDTLADGAAASELPDILGKAANVLYAPDLSASGHLPEWGYRLFNTTRRLTAALATMAVPPRMFILGRRDGSDDHPADPADAVLWGLGRALASEHPEIWGGVVDVEETEPPGVGSDPTAGPVGDIKDVWRVCEPEERRALLQNHVGVLVAAVMGLPSAQSLNPDADFFELGMDSLMNVILQRALAETLGEVLPQTVVFDYPTVTELADHLAEIADADLPESVG
jgi:acyl transferase domain-containing protein/acyl carrier protein